MTYNTYLLHTYITMNLKNAKVVNRKMIKNNANTLYGQDCACDSTGDCACALA